MSLQLYHLVAESKHSAFESLGTGSPLYRDTTVISECHPHGTATNMKHHLEEEANMCSMLCPV